MLVLRHCNWLIHLLLLATRTISWLLLDRQRRNHNRNRKNYLRYLSLIFTRSQRSTLLITTPTTWIEHQHCWIKIKWSGNAFLAHFSESEAAQSVYSIAHFPWCRFEPVSLPLPNGLLNESPTRKFLWPNQMKATTWVRSHQQSHGRPRPRDWILINTCLSFFVIWIAIRLPFTHATVESEHFLTFSLPMPEAISLRPSIGWAAKGIRSAWKLETFLQRGRWSFHSLVGLGFGYPWSACLTVLI